jgi:ATP-dependent RNA helicase SUPV3L1/SUV3
VLDASKALDAASATGDAQKIRQAMATLDAALKGQVEAQKVASALAEPAQDAIISVATDAPETPSLDRGRRRR